MDSTDVGFEWVWGQGRWGNSLNRENLQVKGHTIIISPNVQASHRAIGQDA